MRKGKIIVFEGLDYSFKETNSKKLYQYIKGNITEKVKLLSFPNYNSESSYFVKQYLQGKYGDLNEVNEYITSLFYLLDRYDTIKKENVEELLNQGYYIILDRYTGSNLIFQSTKIDQRNEESAISNILKIDYLKWIKDLEYNICKLPKADVTIYMNMPVKVSFELMKERQLKNQQDKDIHEGNKEYLELVEENAMNIAITHLWNIVNCTDEQLNIKSEEELFNEILDIFKNNCTN